MIRRHNKKEREGHQLQMVPAFLVRLDNQVISPVPSTIREEGDFRVYAWGEFYVQSFGVTLAIGRCWLQLFV